MTAPEPRPTKALSDFFVFAKDFHSLIGFAGKALILIPLADFLLNLGPPWPHRVAISCLLSITATLILAHAFEFWKNSGTLSNVRRQLGFLLRLFFVLLFIYACLFAAFVRDVPDMWHRESTGFLYNSDVELLLKESPGRYTPKDLIELFNDPERVWLPWTVTVVRVVLFSVWIALNTCLFAYLSAFVSILWRRQANR